MTFVQNHNYPGYEVLGDVFNISAAASFEVQKARVVATSGQIGEASDYSPFTPNGVDGKQFEGGHARQFDVAMHNIQKSLAAASPNLNPQQLWEGVFNITSFHVGAIPQNEQLEIAAVARKYLGANKPAWAAICVAALFPPKCLVEIQVQAAYPSD
jgi:enamine deaminase RidA (YjgF/YER057c/UK114 family)